MPQRVGSALVQIMTCRLFGAKPLPEPMLASCQLGLMGTNFSEIRIAILSFSFNILHLKLSSAKMAAILSRGDEFTTNLGSWIHLKPAHERSLRLKVTQMLIYKSLQSGKIMCHTKIWWKINSRFMVYTRANPFDVFKVQWMMWNVELLLGAPEICRISKVFHNFA